jgi:hypothetical protein
VDNWDTVGNTAFRKNGDWTADLSVEMLLNTVAVQEDFWIRLHQHSSDVLEEACISMGKRCSIGYQ